MDTKVFVVVRGSLAAEPHAGVTDGGAARGGHWRRSRIMKSDRILGPHFRGES